MKGDQRLQIESPGMAGVIRSRDLIRRSARGYFHNAAHPAFSSRLTVLLIPRAQPASATICIKAVAYQQQALACPPGLNKSFPLRGGYPGPRIHRWDCDKRMWPLIGKV